MMRKHDRFWLLFIAMTALMIHSAGAENDLEVVPGESIQPIKTVERSICHAFGFLTYGDGPELSHSFYPVSEGKQYFFTASSASYPQSYPAGAFYDLMGNWLLSFGTDRSTIYREQPIIAPEESFICVLNRNNGLDSTALKEAAGIIDEAASAQESDDEIMENKDDYLSIADKMIRLENRNPFQFAPFDQGYLTFIFDDLTTDLDIVASVFEEYGYPLVIAAIPKRMDEKTTGLKEPRGSYEAGMTMTEIMRQVVANGGEIMAHNASPVVSEDNQFDYDFMYRYFVQSKKTLEKAGFRVRGIIRAGGNGAIMRSEEIDRWLVGNYEYANMGTLPQYTWDRTDSTGTLQKLEKTIDEAYMNHIWVPFMCHGLDFYHMGEAISDEAKLGEILDYCGQKGIQIVTCAYIFDHFSSSLLEEKIRALEAQCMR